MEDLSYRVNNRGFTSVVTSQQLEFLQKDQVNENDIVIFYDGGNNQWQGVVNADPKGTIIGSNRKLLPMKVLKDNLSKLQAYKLLKQLKNKNNNYCNLIQDETLKKLANKAFDFYKRDLNYAKKYTKKRNAKFLHFMQPHLFSSYENARSKYEEILIRSKNIIPKCTERYLTLSSSVFSKRHNELNTNGVYSFDISKMFNKKDPRRPKGEHFLDWIHVTENGNQAIAKEIFKKIKTIK